MVLPAYVTSRIIPGTVHIFCGAWFNPDTTGIDRRGNSALMVTDQYAPVMEPFNALVEVSSASTAVTTSTTTEPYQS